MRGSACAWRGFGTGLIRSGLIWSGRSVLVSAWTATGFGTGVFHVRVEAVDWEERWQGMDGTEVVVGAVRNKSSGVYLVISLGPL